MWMRAEKEGYREGEGVHLSVSKKEHERWLYFGFNLRASIQENAVGSVALKGTLLNHQTKLPEYTQMRLATTTRCSQHFRATTSDSSTRRRLGITCGCSTFRIRPRGGVRAAGWMFSPQLVSKLRWVPAFFLGFQRSPKRPAIAFLCVWTWSDPISFLKTQVIRSVLRTIKGSPRHQEV